MATRSRRHNLPADLTTFVGRGDEVARVREVLRQVRLCTLVGIGGVGKSRIAGATASSVYRAFPDGVWRTDFSGTDDPSFVGPAIADSLPGPDSVRTLAEQIGDRNMLLVFDNCDRMAHALGDLSVTLLEQCPRVRILATSRTPFGVSPEHVVRVASFPVDDADSAHHAIELFCDRADAASGVRFAAQQYPEIAALCERLDGLPLAIELAALRTRTMSVRDIGDRLVNRFELLRGGPRDLHPRHQSLGALLEWTWDNCTPEQRAMWAQFSVFASSATLPALEQVCELPAGADAADVVDELMQQSIVIRAQAGDTVIFRMLDTIREYGERRLADDYVRLGGLTARDLRQRHLAFYSALAANLEREWFGPNQIHASATVGAEIGNLRAAFDWSVQSAEFCASGAAMVADLWFYWIGCGHLKEGRTWSQVAWNRLQHYELPQIGRLQWTLAWNLLITGETDAADRHLIDCLTQAVAQGDRRSITYSHALLAAVGFFRGERDASFELYRRAIAESRERGDDLGVAMFNYHFAEGLVLTRDFDEADQCCRTAIDICLRNGDQWCRAYARWVQGLSAYLRKRYDVAAQAASEALALMQPLDDHLGIGLIGELLGWIAARTGDYSGAATLLGATETYWTEMGCALMGIPPLMDQRALCQEVVATQLSAAALRRATDKGRVEGLAWVAPRGVEPVEPSGDSPRTTVSVTEDLSFLTPREAEIALLIARGLTNQDIADTLVVSKRTVDTHVGHILAKCGVRRRGELTSMLFNLTR